MFSDHFASRNGVVNRVFLAPVWVPVRCTVDELVAYCNAASAGKNFRLGLYGRGTPNWETPLGAPLLAESGNIAAAVGGLVYAIVPPVIVPAGLVWLALATEDAVMQYSASGNADIFENSADPMMGGCHYLLGAWGALTNPCPAVTRNGNARVICGLHTALWQL